MRLLSLNRIAAGAVLQGTDKVLMGFPVPSDCSLVNFWGEVSAMYGVTGIGSGIMYGFDGYLIPIIDPDAGQAIEVLWDTQVPKMDQDLSYELSDASDTAPRYEPGQELTEAITGISFSSPEQVYKRRRLLTFANSPTGFDVTTPSFMPTENFKVRIQKRYRALMESALLFAWSQPNMDDDVQNVELLPTGADEEWAMMKYIDMAIKDMMVHVLGLGSVGSGTVPWSVAETFLENLVSDFATIDGTPFASSGVSADVFMVGTAQIVVPGELPSANIHAE